MASLRITGRPVGRLKLHLCKSRTPYRGIVGALPMPHDYVGGIERGERNVALVNIEKLARALKISLSELFRGV